MPQIISGLENYFRKIYSPKEYIAIDDYMMPFIGKMKNRVYTALRSQISGV